MATPHHLLKKRGALKVPESLFWVALFSRSLTVMTPLGMLRAMLHIRIKWPNVTFYFCMVLHDIVVCLLKCCMILYCMIFCCMYCLLKAFLNCHSVCRPNNMYAPLSTTFGGSNHGLLVFIRFGYLVVNSLNVQIAYKTLWTFRPPINKLPI